jgi:hypothetical protein
VRHEDFRHEDGQEPRAFRHRGRSRRAKVKRLLWLGGAIVAEHDEGGSVWTTLHDIEGNEFCLF